MSRRSPAAFKAPGDIRTGPIMKRESGHGAQGRGQRSQRQLRVGEMLRHELSDAVGRGDLRDPDLVDVMVTVTEVRVSPDLKNATAYVLPLGGEDATLVVAALNRAKNALEEYNGSVANADSLRIMAAAYDNLGMEDLASDARRVLELNFPGES